jgi:hypothetical protein
MLWQIEGCPGYYFGEDKKLYNAKTGREIKRTINSRSIGYWIGRKFYTLNNLRGKLKKIETIETPF